MTWRCPTCSGTAVPPSWVKTKAEWDELTDRERAAAEHLLFGLRIYSSRDFPDPDRPERGWIGEIADAIREILPSFWDAWDVADDGICRYLLPDPEDNQA